MKKLYTFFILAGIAFHLNSQTYHPILDSVNEWRYCADVIGVRVAFQSTSANTPCFGYPYGYYENAVQYTNGDTVINSITYKKLVMGEPNWNNYCLYGFVREDTATRRFYFLDTQNNPEMLLYDFSMQIGDTIVENFISMGGYYLSGNYILDSIGTINISAGQRNIYYLNNPAGGHTLWWIESVGHSGFLIYPYSINTYGGYHFNSCFETPHDFMDLLTCFHHQGRIYYDSCAYQYAMTDGCIMLQDTCNYWNICGNISELRSLYNVDLIPNPASGHTTIKMEVTQNIDPEIQLIDATGKRVITALHPGILEQGQHNIDLNLQTIPPGFYLVRIVTQEGSGFLKLIVN